MWKAVSAIESMSDVSQNAPSGKFSSARNRIWDSQHIPHRLLSHESTLKTKHNFGYTYNSVVRSPVVKQDIFQLKANPNEYTVFDGRTPHFNSANRKNNKPDAMLSSESALKDRPEANIAGRLTKENKEIIAGRNLNIYRFQKGGKGYKTLRIPFQSLKLC